MATTTQIRQCLDSILNFMQPHWGFVNCHMVNYLTHKHWESYIPLEIQKEISNVDKVRDCIESIFSQNEKELSKFPVVKEFIKNCSEQRLESFNDIRLSISDLYKELGIERKQETKVSIKEFLSDKKCHEVEEIAELVNNLITKRFVDNEDVYIIDAGDGKGYLSSRLALQYKHKVLGIDANESNTESALERSRKLHRVWNGIVNRAELLERGVTPPKRGKKIIKTNVDTEDSSTKENLNYFTTARYIDSDLDMKKLLKDYFSFDDSSSSAFCLTGLHTCGNLAVTCLRAFHTQPDCKVLCNIGCCYHFLKEAYTLQLLEHTEPNNLSMEIGFPMSSYLHEQRTYMGRNARMLAAQCIERALSARELPNISLFYRALLELLIFRKDPNRYNIHENIQVGRIRKFQNFQDYVKQCAKRINAKELLSLDPKQIDNVELEFIQERSYLEIFYLLRMHFASILESIILLDRLLYLREIGYEKSYIVSAFDAVISPRHYAIVALKD